MCLKVLKNSKWNKSIFDNKKLDFFFNIVFWCFLYLGILAILLLALILTLK